MDIKRLEYFIAVAREENVTKASEMLFISQPTLSLALKRMEAELGVPLFEKRGRNIKLTEYGRILLAHAGPIMQHWDAAKLQIGEHLAKSRCTISISAPPLFMFSGLLETLENAIPGLTLNYKSYPDQAAVRQALIIGELDACFTLRPIEDSRVISQHLMNRDMMVLLPKDHPLAGQSEIPLRFLEGERFAADKRSNVRPILEELSNMTGIPCTISCDTQNSRDLVLAVASGQYISIVPKPVDSAQYTPVALVKLIDPPYKAPLTLNYLADNQRWPQLMLFVRQMTAFFQSNYG